MSARFTHLRDDGAAHMVDVSAKTITTRRAVAQGFVRLNPQVVAALHDATVPKGDVFAVARVAAIQAVKRTPEWIPLAHPVRVDHVEVELTVADGGVAVAVTVQATDRTGIEMEAMTGVSAACLTIVDMTKALDKHAVITDLRVVAKSGGRSGDWSLA